MPTAWASLNGTRKMTAADGDWFATAEEIAGSGVPPLDEVQLRFAMGKYCDDIKDYEHAFANFRRGNELLKSVAGRYNRKAHGSFADDLIRVHTRETLASITEGGSASAKPIFVLGMPRSGTSLTEQIIASHPAAGGVGEPDFWLKAARAYHDEIRQKVLDLPARKKLAEDYLRLIERRCPDALRIVDKTPTNSDFVGFIHSVFPNARIIRMRRDPIDTCLSCYFQNFSTAQTFTMDLARSRGLLPYSSAPDGSLVQGAASRKRFSKYLMKGSWPIKRAGHARFWISSASNGMSAASHSTRPSAP